MSHIQKYCIRRFSSFCGFIFCFALLLISFAGKSQTTSTLTVSGTFTVPCNVTSLQVECWGGGGGGGGDDNGVTTTAGSGGGGGGYCINTIAVTPGQAITYTVGAAGAAGASTPGAGGPGGNTIFSTIVGNGGGGGATANGSGGAGGGGSGGTVTNGANGIDGNAVANYSGAGGLAGNMGSGNGAGLNAENPSNPGTANTGGGGGGAQDVSGGANAGGAGGTGKIVLTYTQVPLSGTYSIGPTGNFATITATLAWIQCVAITGPVIFELQTTYTDASETYPLNFTNILGASAVNTITYRPVSGATGLICDGDPGSTISLVNFDNADYITFDGRAGGAGATQWTVRNLRTAATVGSVFKFINDATNNTLTYLKIEGDVAENLNTGLVLFSNTTGTGNDNNTISYCHIKDLAVADGGAARFPRYGIYSYGDVTAGEENSGNIVDNCQFYDVFESSSTTWETCPIKLNQGADAWTITNNHFYQTTAYADLRYAYKFISIDVGGGYTVSNNYMGGTAINAGGSKFTVTDLSGGTTGKFRCITITCTGAASTLNANTIANIQYTSEYTSTNEAFVGIQLLSTAAFTVGAPGNGNIIGSTTTAGSITLTNNAASGSLGFAGIYNTGSSASTTIKSNIISGITVNGTRTDARTTMIASSAGTPIIESNLIGEDVVVQVGSASGSVLNGIYVTSTGGDVKRNLVRNLINTATAGAAREINGIKLEGTTWNVHNNVVIISNGGNTNDMPIYGIHDNNSNASTLNIYHNTVKIAGTGSGSSRTAALYRLLAGTDNVKNNIFQNIRSAGTGGNFAIYAAVTTGTFTNDDNYLEVTENTAKLGYWSADQDLANWITNTTATSETISGTTTIDGSGGAGAGFVGENAGEDLTATVPVDFDNTTRTSLPWMGAFENPAPLPVELFYFTAHCEQENVLLHWTTASEMNNGYFTIERSLSPSGEGWSEVDTVQGAGNSSTIRNYEFWDNELPTAAATPTLYYRLKQTDFDGNHAYSNAIAANCNKQEAQNVVVYPNPSDGSFSILCQNKKTTGLIEIKIFNVFGEIVYSENMTGNNLIPVTLHQKLSPGVYLLSVMSEDRNNSSQQKIVIK